MSHESKESLKAYRDLDFLNSSEARVIRILCEYLEPMKRFGEIGIKDTIVFFGSAQSPSEEQLRIRLEQEDISESKRDMLVKLGKYREDAVELSRRLTKWSMSLDNDSRFVICSGGGPGIMEAANEGAALAGGKSIGLNISLPMEQESNPYISEGLNFEFHYFFMRKFWFAYMAKALIIFPGGFGTLEELFEMLTLIQTQKLQKKMAVVIYGTEYWNEVVNFNKMVEWGTIGEQDMNLFHFSDDPRNAFQYVTTFLEQFYLTNGVSTPVAGLKL